ncbi:MAG: FkbM family methyltransferase [Actinomycetota bacterium]
MAGRPKPPTKGAPLSRPIKPSTLRRAQRLAAKLPPKWDRRVREAGKQLINYRGARSVGMRGLLFRVLGRYSRLLATPFGKGLILVDSTDDEIGRMVFMKGEYERLYMAAALEYLGSSAAYGELGPVFIDVGANIGISTLDALLHFGFKEAICFEPDSRNFRLLRLNILLNDLDDRVTAHRLALSDSDGEGVIERAEGNFGDSHLVAGEKAAGSEQERVSTRRLDSMLAEGSPDLDRIGLLWIDAQGHDPFVLSGARSVLRAGVPVVVEYWPKALSAGGAFELFESLVAEHYSSVVDLRRLCEGAEDRGVLAGRDIRNLRAFYEGAEFTDLLLVR